MKMHKTPQGKRKTYTYESLVTEENTTLQPGEDGVTEEWISWLHRADDREVENNLKQAHPPRTAKKKAQVRQWKAAHPGEDPPENWNLSIDALVSDEDGDPTQDRKFDLADPSASEFYDPCSNAAGDRLHEIIHELPPRQRKALLLTWFEGYSQRKAAKIMNCSEANISKLLRKAYERIGNDKQLIRILFRKG